MTVDKMQIRPATPDDASALAELINLAGEDLPVHLWERSAHDGETPWDVGKQRARRKEGGFSYRNATVIEGAKGVESCLIGYPVSGQQAPVDTTDIPDVIIPLVELEQLAGRSWYINAIATFQEARGRGHATRLLALAEDVARRENIGAVTLIVSDANQGALRLYESHHYAFVNQRPMIKAGWENPGENWLLLKKTLPSA